MNNQFWYIAVEKFGPEKGDEWNDYIQWSGLHHLIELVSLDYQLCPPILDKTKIEYWPYIVNSDLLLHYFTDLNFLRSELKKSEKRNYSLLSVIRNPYQTNFKAIETNNFCFLGFDLVEHDSGISALSNCGGWPELDNAKLSNCGLMTNYQHAKLLQNELKCNYPQEPHANCDIWAIAREQTVPS